MNSETQIVPKSDGGLVRAPSNLEFGGVGGAAIRTLIRLAIKRRIVVLAIMLAALLGGIAYYVFATPVYRTSATLEIAREVTQIVEDETSPRTFIDAEFYETQYGVLRSLALAEMVVRQLNLSADPKFMPAKDDVALSGPEAKRLRERIAAERVMDMIRIVPARNSRLVELQVTSADPVLASRIANMLADVYIRQNLQKRIDRSAYARRFLDQRIQQVRTALEDSERKLVAYAGNQQIISVPSSNNEDRAAQGTASQSLAGSDLAATSEALIAARAARAEVEGRWRAAQASGGNQSSVLLNPAITALMSQRAQLSAEAANMAVSFDETYQPLAAKRAQIAQLDRQISRIQGQLINAVRTEYDAAVLRERELARQVERLKVNIVDLSNRSIQYTILQREVDTNRALYEGLLQQYKRTGVATDIGSNNVNVMQRAEVPRAPYAPKLVRTIGVSILIGLLGAIAVVGVIEILDARITSPEDFRERLEYPLLGIVPVSATGNPIEDIGDVRATLTEAYSSIHANLRFITAEGAPRVIGITSTRASEGKSTTSAALAFVFARRGDRVVIVDADMRRPSVHKYFKIENRNGLSNLLAGVALDASMVQTVEAGPIDVITAGPLPPSPSDLLASPRLAATLSELKEKYDRVIVDSPPVLGLADAPLISSTVDGMIYVVQANGPRLGPIRRAVERILEARGQIFGFVFTRYSARGSIFSDDYGSYGEYYSYGSKKKGDKD